jgi:hypothetical protein
VPFDADATTRFLLALVRRAPRALITVPSGDVAAERALAGDGVPIDDREEARDTDLARLHRHLFAEQPPDHREPTGELRWLSAPGEARESVEIARRILKEAARGVRFDDIAILLRSPESYVGLLEHALDRAGIPAAPGVPIPPAARFWPCCRARPRACRRHASRNTCRSVRSRSTARSPTTTRGSSPMMKGWGWRRPTTTWSFAMPAVPLPASRHQGCRRRGDGSACSWSRR